MRTVLFLLVVLSGAVAAPVPKAPGVPGVEVVVGGDTQIMTVTIRNDGREALELPYQASPWEHLSVVLRGDNGKSHTLKFDPKDDPAAKPGTLTVPAGKSVMLDLHVCHAMPLLGNPEKVTASVQLKLGNKTADAKPFVLTD